MKLIKRELGAHSTLELVSLNDLHDGNSQSRAAIFEKEVAWLAAKPNRYAILNGDLGEMALRDSYGEVYDQKYSPQEQVQRIAVMLAPVKDRILGCVSGNHERRVMQRTSIDPAMWYAAELGVPYDPVSMVLAFRFGPPQLHNPYFVTHFTHGWGAARSKGAQVAQPYNLKDVVENADVHITAHSHNPASFPQDTFVVDVAKGVIGRRTRRFVVSGSGLDYSGYVEEKGYAPSTMEFPKIIYWYDDHTHGKRTRTTSS